DPAELLERARDDPLDVGARPDVGPDGQGLAAHRLDGGDRGYEVGLGAERVIDTGQRGGAVADNHVGAGLGQRDGVGPALPTAATRGRGVRAVGQLTWRRPRSRVAGPSTRTRSPSRRSCPGSRPTAWP